MSDERIRKSVGDSRTGRESEDRAVTQNRELSDSERLEMLRGMSQQSILPNLPGIEGYHVCWLSTKSPQDSIARRLQLGYELIRAEEVPAFSTLKVTSGEFAGYIGVNEMIAAKIPEHIHHLNMKFFHQIRPREEEERMNAARETIKEMAAERNLRVEEDEAVENWK